MNEIEEIKSRLNIVDYVGRVVVLKKSGANYKGICPFHSEKTPSFMVSPEKQIYHCFGCNEGGDVFEWLVKIEGLTFAEALRKLALDAGVPLPEYKPRDENDKNREKIFAIQEVVCEFFEDNLRKPAGKTALEYLQKRGLSAKTISEFRLGYAPLDQRTLFAELNKSGYSESLLIGSGVANKKNGRLVGRFLNRVTYPVINQGGRVVGFSARVLDDRLPKYINTPATEIYDKSNLLYGFYQAREGIRKQDHAIVVEGNMDVIASHQAGVKNVVASSGTALTERQLDMIKRFTPNIKLAFDIDPAGDNATKRAIEMAFAKGINIKIIEIPEGKDAADAVSKDKNIWIEACKSAVYVVDYIFEKAFSGIDIKNILAKKKATKEFLNVLAKINDPVERSHYLKKLSEKIEVEEEILTKALQGTNKTKEDLADAKDEEAKSGWDKTEERLLGFMMLMSTQASYVFSVLDEEDFQSPELLVVYKKAKIVYNDKKFSENNFLDLFDTETKKIIQVLILKAEMEVQDMDAEGIEEEIFYLTKKIKKENFEKQKKELAKLIKKAENDKDTPKSQDLIKRLQEIIKREQEV